MKRRQTQTRGRRYRPTSLVSRLAGAPIGLSRTVIRPRRGSTLVLVVSAIALLSVLVAAYLAIGRGDIARSRTAVAVDRVGGDVKGIGDYIAGIVGDDVLSIMVEGDTFDYQPGTLSLVRREAIDYPFTDWDRKSDPTQGPGPTGSPGTPAYDRLRFSPVGSISPDWIRGTDIEPFPASDPWLASTLPTWLNPTNNALPEDWLEWSRDWAKITNIAPDGRFVNLFNLRNNFGALPGTRPGQTGMSDRLTLFDQNGVAQLNPQLDIGGPADPNIPAHWDSRQREMFRPAVGLLNPNPTILFHDPLYLPYQYADADGDGMYDSRWQELVDATDPDNILSLLPTDDEHRWFVAARIVDLASLVNVNTATDLRSSPENHAPLGLTPADIDVRRLLCLNDSFDAYPGLMVDGYNQLHVPPGTPWEQDYSNYVGTTGMGLAAWEVAKGAYNAVIDTVFSSQVLLPLTPSTPYVPRTAEERLNHYLRVGSMLPTSAYYDAGTYRAGGLFGTPDLLELLTYRGLNDSGTLSRLEQTMAGRTQNQNWHRYDPLRSNRWTSIERQHQHDAIGRAIPATAGSGSPMFWSALDVRQLLTTISWARPLTSSPLIFDLGDPVTAADGLADAMRQLAYVSPLLPPELQQSVRETPIDLVQTLDRIGAFGQTTDYMKIFRGYADALLPMARDKDIWTVPAKRSVSYGNNPEFALRTAAALTVNLIDLYDEELTGGIAHQQTSRTVLFRADKRTEVAGDPTKFPFWADAPLDLGDAFLPTQGTDVRAMNVHGVEAQPFITEIAAYNIYTDTPNSRGGDMDWELIPDPIDPTATIPNLSQHITIDGKINGINPAIPATDNPDFIAQVVAFQVSNPFDYDIVVSQGDPAAGTLEYSYYIDFGGNEFPLIEHDEASGIDMGVTIQPRETVVFYALSMPKGDGSSVGMTTINGRFKNADVEGVLAGQDVMQNWIDRQLAAPGVRVIRTRPLGATGFTKLLAGTGGSSVAIGGVGDPNREVTLWRAIIQPSIGETPQTNQQFNDIMLDRLRDPVPATTRASLDQRIPEASDPVVTGMGWKGQFVKQTQAGEEGSIDPARRGDNTGYTITTWGAIRRPTEGMGNATPRGALPAWCLERKFGPSLNDDEDDPADPYNMLKCHFVPGMPCFGTVSTRPKVGGNDLATWRDRQAPTTVGSGITLLDTISQEPDDKDVPPLSPAEQADGFNFSDIYSELHLNNSRFRVMTPGGDQQVTMRPADVLLPLGVATFHDPDDDDPNTPNVNEAWTTFGEALTEALGYDMPPPGPVIGGATPPPSVYDALDRGQLELHGYFDRTRNEYRSSVPFIDADGDLHLDPSDPAERRLGLGIPISQAVVENFTTFPPRTGDFRQQYGSISGATVGVINANTAPLQVKRALPGLSPSSITNEWWWPTGSGDQLGTGTDIASTAVAYRDRTRIVPRFETAELSFVGESGIPGHPRDVLGRFDPANKNYALFGLPCGVAGIRQETGFAAKAELLAVNHYVSDLALARLLKHNIDHLGDPDDNATSIGDMNDGVDPIRYGTTKSLDDEIANDYDEQLTLANGVLNSVSVRSDTFACWFVVHGYKESDATGLKPSDPLTPSVARRFLMVIDRSNVTRLGEKPRILLFRELPLK